MCGIGALIAKPGCRVDPALAKIFDAKLAHRGPDAAGSESFARNGARSDPECAEIALIHRRLSIIDLDTRSNQPMLSDDGRYALTFNGEIYNYVELRSELEREGHTFRTKSDTEVLLKAYMAWGERALSRFSGMFAFALMDTQRGELFIARDPFGIKPLFWAQGRDVVAFASEIGPVLDVPGVTRRADLDRSFLFLSTGQTDSGEATLFADVRSLPAGTYARISLRQPSAPSPQIYWSPLIAPQEQNFDQSAVKLRDLFLDSIRLHLRSDVPVGIALSGGIDSSSILAGARKIGGANLLIQTFSFVAAGSDLDESRYIDMAAASAGASNRKVQIEPKEIVEDIEALLRTQGEPCGGLSIYAQNRVMRLAAANGIKVMLDGQGADELFAGYRPYLARRLTELLAGAKIGEAVILLRNMLKLPGGGMALVAQALEPAVPVAVRGVLRRIVGRPFVPAWIDQGWFESRGAAVAPLELPRRQHVLHEAMRQSLTQTVLPALLRFEDRNSMAYAIESRVPFLTPALAEFAYSLPSDQFVDATATSKSILRAAMRGLVPDVILDRRDKIGFATPDKLWGRSLQPWFQSVLGGARARSLPWLRASLASTAYQRRVTGGSDVGFDLWRVASLVRWAELYDVEFG